MRRSEVGKDGAFRTFRLSKKDDDTLRLFCEARGISVSAYSRHAVRAYMQIDLDMQPRITAAEEQKRRISAEVDAEFNDRLIAAVAQGRKIVTERQTESRNPVTRTMGLWNAYATSGREDDADKLFAFFNGLPDNVQSTVRARVREKMPELYAALRDGTVHAGVPKREGEE